ncbi:hypothetical protein IQ06DRAFT_44414 [Phaeosphaeriaceae sp. SRC1lsM3a]|nr:hypothetical protein IQ06DRAFT_44414 [Stagonospora sp. SRC1lsM3a]
MKVTLLLLTAAAAVMAQSVDTVSATASGVCEPHNDHWHCPAGVPEPTTPPALPVSGASSAASVMTSAASHSHDDEDDHDHDHAASASTCEPHGDHWHCPSGVSKPTTPPAAASTCSPHGDHWHCPSGVAEPATPPASTTTSRSGSAAAASGSTSAPPQNTGGASKAGTGALALVGAVGAFIL